MSQATLDPASTEPEAAQRPDVVRRRKRARAGLSLVAQGQPMLWLTGGALAICVLMIVGILGLILASGLKTFWPVELVRVETVDGRVYMGEESRVERFTPTALHFDTLPEDYRDAARAAVAEDGTAERRLIRTGNFRITQTHYDWINGFEVAARENPEWALVVERLEWGRFYGIPEAFVYATFLEKRDANGFARPVAELREEASALLEDFSPRFGGEPTLVVERFVRGDSRMDVADLSELDSVNVVGVAEIVRGAENAWEVYQDVHPGVRERWDERRSLEKHDTGEVNALAERARLARRDAELILEDRLASDGAGSPVAQAARADLAAAEQEYEARSAWVESEFVRIRGEIDEIDSENERFRLLMRTAGEGTSEPVAVLMPLDDIVLAYPANQLGLLDKLGVYFERWLEYLTEEPREANSEGGVYPAIFGTVIMTLIMAIAVVPFGVLAALYLKEYAKAGPIVSAVRIAVNNLAGVPSIVFGVFGLGFFCYLIGANVDDLLFRAKLPNPTFGKGGLLWASLTLALLTLPVVIVATEEALSAVPNSMREGSYACGASKWQTIRRIVLPRAMPGIMTGMILAMARGAGEVAPLMLVGAVKLAPELPIDGVFPYVHPERSFMHLGFHIFDVGFQSQNSEAARPMVYTTALLLIVLVFLLNLVAIRLRKRLASRFQGAQV